MKRISILIFSFTLLCGQASAGVIGWGATPSPININDTFSLTITGSGFTSNVDGGGANFSFNSSILNVTSVTIDETVWDFGGAGISTGSIDNAAGTVNGIMVNTFSVVSGNFDVATIEFLAVGSGTTALTLTEYGLNPWSSGGSLLNPTMADSLVTVSGVSAVPVPAAVWLFSSGILGLVGMARRKNKS